MMPPATGNLRLARVVLFDLDGTLLDAVASHSRVYRAVFSDLGAVFDDAAYARHYSPNWYLLYERMGVPRDRWDEADRLWLQHYAKESPVEREGATDLLHRLQASGRALGLVTSGDRSRVDQDLSRMRWTDLFHVVVCGGEVPERKPHPAALQHALRTLGESESAAAYVGDTIEDVQMGKAAGVFTVAVSGGFTSRQALKQTGPDVLVDSLRDLTRLLSHE